MIKGIFSLNDTPHTLKQIIGGLKITPSYFKLVELEYDRDWEQD